MNVKQKYIYWIIFSFGVILLTFIQYYGLIHFNYLVPPGDDGANHLSMTMPFYEGKVDILRTWKSGTYPPGYHIAIARFAHIFNTEPLNVMLWTYPAILIFSGLAIFFLAYVIFGPSIALISFFIYSFTTRTPIQLLNDGGYPNLLAAHVFLPISLAFLILAIGTKIRPKKIANILLSMFFMLLVFLTHHISTFYIFGIAALFVPVYLIVSVLIHRGKYKNLLWVTLLYIASLMVLFVVYRRTELFAPARNLAAIMFQPIDSFPYFKAISQLSDSGSIYDLTEYPARIGKLIVPVGFFSIIYLPYILRKESNKYLVPITILACWTMLLLFGSRLTFLTNPERMARDLAVPLSILSATTLFYLWKENKELKGTLKRSSIVVLFMLTIAFLGYSPARDRIKNSLVFEPMVRATDADKKVIDYLNANSTSQSRILVFSYNFYLPFLLSGYSIQNAYWLNPDTRTNKELLEQYDLYYVVDSQRGWVPDGVDFGLSDIFKRITKQVLHEKSSTNEVYLFSKN